MPLMTATVYDNTASAYNVSRIMTADGTFDAEAYAAYSPAYLPAAFAFVYGLSFASLTSVPVHIWLHHGQEIKDGFTGRGKLDVHARLMQVYSKVPWWWYVSLTVIVEAMALAMVYEYNVHLPWLATQLLSVNPNAVRFYANTPRGGASF